MLTFIIMNFNSDSINTLDITQSLYLKSTDKGLGWFSNVVIEDLYYNFVT